MTHISAHSPTDESIGGCFARVAARNPDKVAVEFNGEHIRFGELDAVSNAIAVRLLAGDPRPPGRVALLFDNPITAIGAMLGVLKSGHAYVILDARDPADRLRFIVGDSEPFALLTDDLHGEQARKLAPAGCEIVSVSALASDPAVEPLPAVSPDATTYLFYTSGSTGRPKGVRQTHRNLRHFVRCYCEALRITEADRLSLLFSLSFSASNMHIYGALLSGATICGYDTRQRGVAPLAEWLDSERVSVVHTVPTVLRRLARGLAPQRVFAHLRAVDLGGEALFAQDLPHLFQHLREDVLLVNHLGATEANVIAQHEVRRDAVGGEMRAVRVGRSPDGVRVMILRPDGSEAALEEVGEIVVSSPFVSPGYWRRPELETTAFAEDEDQPGWRLFCPGDLGRLTAAGELVFLGRVGSRVKIRGHSVDVHEVEAGLRQCQDVTDAAVVATAGGNDQEADRLVAYVVCAGSDAGRDDRRLRRELTAHLPDYMLPSVFHFVSALPQTATGKTDRLALAKMNLEAPVRAKKFDAPRGPIEAKIAGAFEKVLGNGPIGYRDDFFLCGGDSLSVMELNVHLVNLFGRDVPSVFEDTTVAGLAAAIRRNQARRPDERRLMPVLLPRRKEGEPPILFLVHGRRGQAHMGPRFIELIGAGQPLYVFQARGVDGIQEPHTTIGAMAADYVAAMMSVQPHGPYFIGGLCSGGFVALKMAHLLRTLGEEAGPLLLIDPPVPPFTKEDAAKNLRILQSGLRTLQRKGNIDLDFSDPNRRRGAIRVATSIEKALLADRPIPYDGPVYLLASREKLTPAGWGNPEKLKSYFAGAVQCFEVGGRHVEILDTNNEDFARHLAQCVQDARQAITTR